MEIIVSIVQNPVADIAVKAVLMPLKEKPLKESVKIKTFFSNLKLKRQIRQYSEKIKLW